VTEGCLLHHPLTQPLPQGGEERDARGPEEHEKSATEWRAPSNELFGLRPLIRLP
jgi:hypothetical protein